MRWIDPFQTDRFSSIIDRWSSYATQDGTPSWCVITLTDLRQAQDMWDRVHQLLAEAPRSRCASPGFRLCGVLHATREVGVLGRKVFQRGRQP
jgi:hypothetical protein